MLTPNGRTASLAPEGEALFTSRRNRDFPNSQPYIQSNYCCFGDRALGLGSVVLLTKDGKQGLALDRKAPSCVFSHMAGARHADRCEGPLTMLLLKFGRSLCSSWQARTNSGPTYAWHQRHGCTRESLHLNKKNHGSGRSTVANDKWFCWFSGVILVDGTVWRSLGCQAEW